MTKFILTSLFLLVSLNSFSQDLIYKNKGNITDSNGKKLTSNEVRALLASNEELLGEYKIGRSKKTIGNVLLVTGTTLICGDIARKLFLYENPSELIYLGNNSYKTTTEPRKYPTVITYIGLATLIVAIPVKIGFTKKIESVVTDYNKLKKVSHTGFKIQSTDVIANSYGVGFRMTFN